MKIQFFLCMGDQVNSAPSFTTGFTFSERTTSQLNTQLSLLTPIVEQAANCKENILPVVLCSEDFFQGAEISTEEEEQHSKGQCFSRVHAYEFISKELRALSKRFPNVLIIPGSMYVSVEAIQDTCTYRQNGVKNKPGSVYSQNIAPILYNGQLIRLLKKGDYLLNKTKKIRYKQESDYQSLLSSGHTIVVEVYAEDTLDDINNGLIHFGKTPLPGENALLSSLGLTGDLFNPIFTVGNIRFGMEICGDHSRETLLGYDEEIDFHLISSNGIGFKYNAAEPLRGYRIQADAESYNLTGICTTRDNQLALHEAGNHLVSQPLVLGRDLQILSELKKDIEKSVSTITATGGSFFQYPPKEYTKMLLAIKQGVTGEIGVEDSIRLLVKIASKMNNGPLLIDAILNPLSSQLQTVQRK